MHSTTEVGNPLSPLQQLEKTTYFEEHTEITEELSHLQKRLQGDTLQLAVVGDTGTGKTTLLQALLGTPWEEGDNKEHAPLLLLENTQTAEPLVVAQYSDGKQITHPFAQLSGLLGEQQIQQLQIKGRVWKTNPSISFVDTSGLGTLVKENRTQILASLLESHGCLYLLGRTGLSTYDRHYLRYLCKYQKNFIFVLNFLDECSSQERETLPQFLEEQERILNREIFPPEYHQEGRISVQFVGLSLKEALQSYTLPSVTTLRTPSRPEGILLEELSWEDVQEGIVLQQEKESQSFEVRYKQSNFDEVKQKILRLYQENKKYLVAQKQAVEVVCARLKHGKHQMVEQLRQEQGQWEHSASYGAYVQYQKQVEQYKERQTLVRQKREHWVQVQMHAYSTMAELDLTKAVEQLQMELEQRVMPILTVEELETFSHRQLSSFLMERIQGIEKENMQFLSATYQQIYGNGLVTQERFSQKIRNQDPLPPFPTVGTPEPMQTFPEEEGKIHQLKQDILFAQREEVEEHQSFRYHTLEHNSVRQHLNDIKEESDQRTVKFQRTIVGMGEKPAPEMKTYQEEIDVKGGAVLAEKVGDFFEGKKIATVTVSYEDDSKAIAWEAQKEAVTKEYKANKARLDGIYKELDGQRKQLVATLELLEEDQLQSKQSLEAMARKLEQLHLELLGKKENARLVYLRAYQSKLIREVGEYLQEEQGIRWKLLDHCRESVDWNAAILLDCVAQEQMDRQQGHLTYLEEGLAHPKEMVSLAKKEEEITRVQGVISQLEQYMKARWVTNGG